METFVKRSFLTGWLPRVWLEVLVVCGLLYLLSLAIYGSASHTIFGTALFLFINPTCALYYALRLRPARGRWYRQIAAEIAMMTFTASTIGALMWLGMKQSIVPDQADPLTVMIYSVALGFPFVFFRVLSRLWAWWGKMRERRLLWSLVNSHLIAVALLQAIVVLPLIVALINMTSPQQLASELPDNPISQLAFRVLVGLPFVALAMLMATAILTAFLPVSAAVSYFFARRVKHRLDALIVAARAARDGDYGARVPVSGQDEIARLQTDFNAMVASLETTVGDLRAERETVQALLKSRRELMANVSHELRTPIATVRGYLDSARRQQDETIVLSEADAEIIEREIIRLQTLIDDLFALSRAEVDQLAIKPAPVDAAAVIARVVGTVAPLAWRINRVEVIANPPSWLPPVLADENRLEQSLRNLIHNSLRHTPPGGVVIVSAREQGQTAVIEVRDTGDGIAPDDLPRVWERYYRAGSTGGTGLGLAIVKTFTEAMGGSVAAESKPGEGACFSLTLPLAQPAPDQEVLPLPQPVPRANCDNSATNPR